MVKFSTKRRQPNVRVSHVEKVLLRSGWERRQTGSHVHFSKPGYTTITLSDPISRNQWMNLRGIVGKSVHDVLIKTRTRVGRGGSLGLRDYQERILAAQDLLDAGFAVSDAVKFTGLGALMTKTGMKSTDLMTHSLADLTDSFLHENWMVRDDRRDGPVTVLRLGSDGQPASVVPIDAPALDVDVFTNDSDELQPIDEPAPVGIPSAAAETFDSAILELLAEMNERLNTLNAKPDSRATAHALQLVRLARGLHALRDQLDVLLESVKEFDL